MGGLYLGPNVELVKEEKYGEGLVVHGGFTNVRPEDGEVGRGVLLEYCGFPHDLGDVVVNEAM